MRIERIIAEESRQPLSRPVLRFVRRSFSAGGSLGVGGHTPLSPAEGGSAFKSSPRRGPCCVYVGLL